MITNSDYEKYAKLISHTIKKFHAAYGGDFEELRGIANLAFVEAMEDWKRSNKKLRPSTFIVRAISWRLLDHFRGSSRNQRREKKMTSSPLADNVPTYTKDNNQMVDLLDEVSKDARTVIQLTIDTPKEMIALYTQGCRTATNVIRIFLKRNGWSNTRVNRAFNEVKGAIA